MRKFQQKQLLELTESIQQAHDEIKKMLDMNRLDIVKELLCNCQECAIQIGHFVEKEYANQPIINVLERYCEIAFDINERLEENVASNKAYKLLNKHLVKIQNSIKYDLPIQYEIVFLPYKACMWDSLESVYFAAQKEENVTCYVIPIPYYDRNPDRSLGMIHYEGNDFPYNIKIIDWKKYDLATRKPDVIFIHNAYDDWNFVTCVHPNFFSDKLKKYTECLVYIPYFVLPEININDKSAIDGMKHFCFLPGIVNADKVIIQSDSMKDIYCEEYQKAINQTNLKLSEQDTSSKFVALGSPKIDKVLMTNDTIIPENWNDLIMKEDGSKKKVIFYNTGIGAVLNSNEKALQKIEYVFKTFKKWKKDIALLWRPHPLIESTLAAMRSTLLEKYKVVKQEYCKEAWGIYDDTSDLERAITISDAYYGDASSVVHLFSVSGKPILLQNCEFTMDLNKYRLWSISASVLVENRIYHSYSGFSGLYMINLQNGRQSYCNVLTEKDKYKFGGFSDSIYHKNKIYFCPFRSNSIIIYDTVNEMMESVDLNDFPKCKTLWQTGHIVKYGDIIYFIGLCNSIQICKFDTLTYEVTYIKHGLEKIEHYSDSTTNIYGRKSCIKNGILYIPLRIMGMVLQLNLLTEESRLLKIGGDNEEVIFAIEIKDDIWFVTGGGRIIIWNNEIVKQISLLQYENEKQIKYEILTYYLMGNKLLLFEANSNQQKKMWIVDCNSNHVDEKMTDANISCGGYIKDDIIYFWGSTNEGDIKIYLFSKENFSYKVNEIIQENEKDRIKNIFAIVDIPFYHENCIEGNDDNLLLHLDNYLTWLVSGCQEDAPKKENKQMRSCGTNILKYIMDSIMD